MAHFYQDPKQVTAVVIHRRTYLAAFIRRHPFIIVLLNLTTLPTTVVIVRTVCVSNQSSLWKKQQLPLVLSTVWKTHTCRQSEEYTQMVLGLRCT